MTDANAAEIAAASGVESRPETALAEATASPTPEAASASSSGGMDGGSAPAGPIIEVIDDGPNLAGSAATAELPLAGPPILWMTGEGASPNVWWRDCSQPFASVLERQLQSELPVCRYTFYGNLQAGPVSFVHDLRSMTQLNESSQQRKRLRRVQDLAVAMAP